MSANRSATLATPGLLLLAVVVAACKGPGPASSGPGASADEAGACTTDEIAASGIAGTIVDSDGNPLNDILVQIDNTAGFTGSTHTPADGTFSAEGVTGTFVITTVDLDYDTVTQRVSVPCGETVDVEIILTPSGS